MKTVSYHNLNAIISFTALLFGWLLARLLYNHAILIAVLMAGVPLLLLAPFSATRRISLILLITLIPLTGVFKPLTGIRYAPVTFDIGILLACVFDLIDRMLNRNLRFDRLDYLFGVFIALAFLQMFNPNVPSLRAGIEGFRKFTFMSIAFYAGRHILKIEDLQVLRKLMLPISFVIALYGLKQFFHLSEFDYAMLELSKGSPVTHFGGGWIRPFSVLPGPFHLGAYLLITILFIISYLMHEKKQLPVSILILFVLNVQLVSLFVTRTKANWIALLIGMFVLVLFQRRGSKVWWLVSGFTLISIIISFVYWATPYANVSEIFLKSVTDAANPIEAPTFQIRLELWKYIVLPAIKSHPFIGYGTSSAGEGLAYLYSGTSSFFFYSHNLFLKIFIEMGFIGFLLFMVIIIISIFKARQFIFQTSDLSNDILNGLRCIIAVVVAILTTGFTGPILDAAPVNYYFWLLLGMLVKSSHNEIEA